MANGQDRLILGVDSSTTATGFSVLKINGKEKMLIEYGVIRPKDTDYIGRCLFILKELGYIIDKYDLTDIAIEQPNSARNMEVTRMLCGLWGMIVKEVYVKTNIFPVSMNTGHVKLITSNSGGADKQLMVKSVNKLFNLKLKYNKSKGKSDDDIADAIGVAYTLYWDLRNEK